MGRHRDGNIGRKRERERKRDRGRDRRTGMQTDKQKDRQIDRQPDRQTNRGDKNIGTQKEINRGLGRHSKRRR
jgi:hypothetical protein